MVSQFLPHLSLLSVIKVTKRDTRTVIKDECPTPLLRSGQRYHQRVKGESRTDQSPDDKLRPLYKGLEKEIKADSIKECGLIVTFPNSGTLLYCSQLENNNNGKADLDYHVKVTNTSPVEMVLLAGQPIGEATIATYWDPQRNIAQIIKHPPMKKADANSYVKL